MLWLGFKSNNERPAWDESIVDEVERMRKHVARDALDRAMSSVGRSVGRSVRRSVGRSVGQSVGRRLFWPPSACRLVVAIRPRYVERKALAHLGFVVEAFVEASARANDGDAHPSLC